MPFAGFVDDMTRETVLITGATGFIGSHVAEALLSRQQYRLIAIARKTGHYKNTDRLKGKGAILYQGEFWDESLLDRIFKAHPIDSVIHLAAIRGAFSHSAEKYLLVNVLGTERLLTASLKHKVRRFVFCSSVGVYGTIPRQCPARWDSPLNGDNRYHHSKILAEKKVFEFIAKGLDAYIVRPTITYGPGDSGFSKTLVTLVRKKLFLLPSEDIQIHLLSVASLVELITQMVAADNLRQRIFIAADQEPVSLRELVNLMYFYCRGVNYPGYLRIPKLAGKILLSASRLMGNEKWLTRLLLISKSWHYDIRNTIETFQFVPARTEESFPKSLSDYCL